MKKISVLVTVTALLLANTGNDVWKFAKSNPYAEPITYAYISSTGDPQFSQGSKISIARDIFTSNPQWRGECSFDNCSIFISIAGEVPKPGQLVQAEFSDGTKLQWGAGNTDAANNYSTVNMGTTNKFVEAVRKANWVRISFAKKAHKFSLAGSSKALNAIIPHIKINK